MRSNSSGGVKISSQKHQEIPQQVFLVAHMVERRTKFNLFCSDAPTKMDIPKEHKSVKSNFQKNLHNCLLCFFMMEKKQSFPPFWFGILSRRRK
jgi:hypothetical protein